jgi:hypothetical protein
MGFPRGPLRAPAPARIRVAVFPVGRRVYVACADERPARVAMTDEAGTTPLTSLGDGTEVAIIAWRPGWAGATRYRVRATDSGLEGWLPVGNLRSTEAAMPSIPSVLPAPVVGATPLRVGEVAESGRRFGQHSHAANVRSSRSMPASALTGPSPSVPASASPQAGGESRDSRRRFGQRSD